jgi:hypothetical protein
MKTRRHNTPRLKRRAKAPPARRQRSSAADLQKQLDRRTRELAEAREQQAATVLRLITSSYFVGGSGRSAGFSLSRMRSM